MSRESSVVTRLIESAQTQTVDADFAETPPPSARREITKTVKIVMRQARSLPVAAALALVAAAFLIGVVLGDQRETRDLTPMVVPSPAYAGVVAPTPEAEPVVAIVPEVSIETGFDLRVQPIGADVILDGRPIGAAPLRVRNLTAGEHVIELAADGFFARRVVVVLASNEAPTLNYSLDRLERPASVPKADPPKAKPAPKAAEKGTLKIGSKPPCEVVVNGRKFGTTPRFIKLDAGRHSVSLVNQTYAINERIRVDIKSGKTVRVIRDYSDVLDAAGD